MYAWLVPVISIDIAGIPNNILARIIKKALIEKQIDLKDYMPRFENQTDMSNFKK